MLERYGHGGDLRTAAELYGWPEDEYLDYSSNMNPLGPPPVLERVLRERWRELARYPDPEVRELRGAIAAEWDVPAEAVWVGNGAAELIDLAMRVVQPLRAAVARPSFREYEEAVVRAGGSVLELQLAEDDGYCVTPDHIAIAAAFGADALLLGHPNNPTGRLLQPEVLEAVRRLPTAAALPTLIDEAFLDFSEDERKLTMIRDAADKPGLIVVRSMTKFYSIPGLRLGYAVAHPDWIRRLKRLQTPWSVSAAAQWAGLAFLREEGFREATLAWLLEERSWLSERLRGLGLHVYESDANFLLYRVPDGLTVRALQREMGKRGILIRDCSTFPGMTERHGRLAVKLRAENERLIRQLEESLQAIREGVSAT